MPKKRDYEADKSKFTSILEERGIDVIEYNGYKSSATVKCRKGHVTLVNPSNVLSGKSSGCRRCARQLVIDKQIEEYKDRSYADAATSDVEILEYNGHTERAIIKCPVGHIAHPIPLLIFQGRLDGWCRTCSLIDRSNKIHEGARQNFRRIAEEKSIEIVWVGLNGEKAYLKCPQCGDDWYVRPSEVIAGVSSCDPCARKNEGKRRRGMAEDRFIEFLDSIGATLIEFESAHKKAKIVCSEGHICEVTPTHYINGHSHNICAQCQMLFNPYDTVYLVVKDEWAKVGRAAGKERLRQHRFQGWEEYAIWKDLPETVPTKVEDKIKTIIKEKGLPTIEPHLMPQDGYTETFPIEKVEIIKQIIEYCLDLELNPL